MGLYKLPSCFVYQNEYYNPINYIHLCILIYFMCGILNRDIAKKLPCNMVEHVLVRFPQISTATL